jgi:hypothetical protein
MGQIMSSSPTTPEEVMDAMERLEEMKEEMSSGDYMNECNRLKDLYYKLKNEKIIRQFILLFT